MINPSCCCSPIGCAGAEALKDAILAVDLGDLKCDISGELELINVMQSAQLTTTLVNVDFGCHDVDCCSLCTGNDPTCNFICNPPSLLKVVQCYPFHSINRRYITSTVFDYYCPGCESEPVIDCEGCPGFPTTSFTSNGFDSRLNIPLFLFSCAPGGFSTAYTVATKTTTTTTGNKTLTVKKKLEVYVTPTSVPNIAPHCVALVLRFRVEGSTTGDCPDSVSESVSYQSVWNGTDTAAQFLAKPMTLHVVQWNYDICPGLHFPENDPNTCYGYDLGSFKDADCGICEAIGATLDSVIVTYPKQTFDQECPPNVLDPTIDPVFQPWIPPTTVTPL